MGEELVPQIGNQIDHIYPNGPLLVRAKLAIPDTYVDWQAGEGRKHKV